MFNAMAIVVSVAALFSLFQQPGIRAHSIKDSSSEANTSSQLKEEWKFQVEENMRLQDELESERQRIKTLENVISEHSAEFQQPKRKIERLQMRRTEGNTWTLVEHERL